MSSIISSTNFFAFLQKMVLLLTGMGTKIRTKKSMYLTGLLLTDGTENGGPSTTNQDKSYAGEDLNPQRLTHATTKMASSR